ncbi:hypothetical protein C8R46DRAFT_1353360 [Mycena filopes]|nr:hypothetical protein C8R46DRAFT_1353360 [Mycena filopes]
MAPAPRYTQNRLISSSDVSSCPLPALLGPPKQLACFSICNERLEVDSTAALRYLRDPPNPIDVDLRDGLDAFLQLPRKDRTFQRARRLDNVFEVCLASANSEELLGAEVVTWRGILTKIMVGPKLDLNVSYHRGVLYLEESCTRGSFDPDSAGTFMGHKFETICSTSAHPDEGMEPETEMVDLHTLWNTAISRTLGPLKILLVGEVDCVKPGYAETPGPEHYVELKTRKSYGGRVPPPISRQAIPNLPKWTIQSRLIGTPEIFVGFPDAAGVVRSCATVRVDALDAAQEQIDWGARVLTRLREYCAAHAATTPGAVSVWRIQVRRGFVDVRELAAWEVKKLNEGGVPRQGIIPVSFVEGLERRSSVG